MSYVKKLLKCLVSVFVFFIITMNTCNAEMENLFGNAIYKTTHETPAKGEHIYRAYVYDYFFQSNRHIEISIEKCNVVYDDNKNIDHYVYAIEITQKTNEQPFDVKKVMIASEYDSVEIPVNSPPNIFKGLDYITNRIVYRDTGKVNIVLESISIKMLIRITSEYSTYDFYPSLSYIVGAQKVAKWALN